MIETRCVQSGECERQSGGECWEMESVAIIFVGLGIGDMTMCNLLVLI